MAVHPFIYAPNNELNDPHTITYSVNYISKLMFCRYLGQYKTFQRTTSSTETF